MGSAIFTGVTGLLAHQRRIDVVANNIANVNTTGYRSSRMIFQDLFSQTIQGATAPTALNGGSNPLQVGLGVRIASIDVNHQQGSLVTTGVVSDLAIQGSGFFVLNNGASDFYTRDGTFALNADGELIDPGTRMRVQGFLADAMQHMVAARVDCHVRHTAVLLDSKNDLRRHSRVVEEPLRPDKLALDELPQRWRDVHLASCDEQFHGDHRAARPMPCHQ